MHKPCKNWHNESEKPATYNLVWIEFADGRAQKGWWDGSTWDFGRRRTIADVLRWKHVTTYETTGCYTHRS